MSVNISRLSCLYVEDSPQKKTNRNSDNIHIPETPAPNTVEGEIEREKKGEGDRETARINRISNFYTRKC